MTWRRPRTRRPGHGDEAETLGVLRRASLNLAAGVASAATAQRLGDSFQYAIEQPVNLPRQKSALLPIVQHDVEASPGERLQPGRPRQVPAARA